MKCLLNKSLVVRYSLFSFSFVFIVNLSLDNEKVLTVKKSLQNLLKNKKINKHFTNQKNAFL